MQIKIDSERIQSEIDELARISEAPPPIVTRVLFSKADRQARAFVQKRCSELKLALREDAVGNFFARWQVKMSIYQPSPPDHTLMRFRTQANMMV
jgi:ureidoglycolate amidohydrolase